MIESKVCHICKGTARLVCSDQPSYRAPEKYRVYYCSQCHTSFSDPMIVDDKIYEMIYTHRQGIPGYGRYERYARDILHEREPLKYLAQSDDVYWGIEQYFLSCRSPADLKVLDIGSGLGYLTYALNKKGFQATGIDLSSVAVENARHIYGDYFIHADIGELALSSDQRYDVAVLAEIIEHIPDIHGTLRKVIHLLKPNGEIVITTPNRAIYSPGVIWETDPPPVHFWWLSERSITSIADDLDLSVRFIDFTEFNKRNYLMCHKNVEEGVVTRRSVLDGEGAPIERAEHVESILSNVLEKFALRRPIRFAYFRIWQIMTRIYLASHSLDLRPGSKMCAVLTKKCSGSSVTT